MIKMTKPDIFLAPGVTKEIIEDGILSNVSVEDMEIEDAELKEKILKEYSSKNPPIWAVDLGIGKYWEKVEYGDYLMFYADKRFLYIGRVNFKYPFYENPEEIEIGRKIVRNVWKDYVGNLEDDEVASYLIFLENIKNIDLPLEEFNKITGYKFRGVQGFTRVSRESARSALLEYIKDVYKQ